jgi:hypothetical protein
VNVPANVTPDGGELEAAEPAEQPASNAQHTSSSAKRLLIVGALGPAGINLRPVRPGVFRRHPEILLLFPLWHLGVFPLFPVYDPASYADRRCSDTSTTWTLIELAWRYADVPVSDEPVLSISRVPLACSAPDSGRLFPA